MKRFGVVLACVAAIGIARAARANGRFPYAQRLIEHPSDPNRLVLAGTYGLVATKDRGQSWYFICEASFARSAGYTGDPLSDFTADENLLVGVQTSMSLSTDQGCQWTTTLDEGGQVVDHALARSDPGRVVAVVVATTDGGATHELRESRDNGRTWTRIGSPVPVGIAYTLDVDPTNPEHVYVSGTEGDGGVLATTLDHGDTWTVRPIPDTGPNAVPYIAGIDPRAPEKIFVRARASDEEFLTRGDVLLYTDDAGGTYRELHRSHARLLGFALSPDGSTVLIGYGTPGYAGSSGPGPYGVFRSATDRFSFEQVNGGHISGISWTKTGIYVLSSSVQDDYEVAFSPVSDFRQDGGCLVPLLHSTEIKGPLACPSETTGAICVADWPSSCSRLGACSSVPPRPRVCAPFVPARYADDDGGTSGTTGTGSEAGDSGGDEGSNGCHCELAARHGAGAWSTALVLALALFIRKLAPSSGARPRGVERLQSIIDEIEAD